MTPPKSQPQGICPFPCQRLSTRPPSVSSFNPDLSVPEPAEGQRHAGYESPTLVFDSRPQSRLPTMEASNFFSEEFTYEEDFFNAEPIERTQSRSSSLGLRQKHHTIAAFPRSDNEELISFPPLTMNSSSNPHIALRRPRPSTATFRHPNLPVLFRISAHRATSTSSDSAFAHASSSQRTTHGASKASFQYVSRTEQLGASAIDLPASADELGGLTLQHDLLRG